jgi:hypothetical protein
MSISFLRRSGWAAIILIIVAAAVYLLRGPLSTGLRLPIPSFGSAQTIDGLPNMPDKPQPRWIPLDSCPPEGEGGDPKMNLLENRVDSAKYVPVPFDSLTTLTWPKNVERLEMKDWSEANLAYISQYEGIPVAVEGYFVNLRESSPEPANCNWESSSYLSWIISFTKNPRDDRSQAVIVEVTPRVRLSRKWTIDLIHDLIIGDHLPVRVSGWLYFDPGHPGDVGLTRATLWSIHPVMQIEAYQDGRWLPLDRLPH